MSVMEQITLKNSVLVVKKQHDFVADNVPNRMKSSKKKKVKDTRKIDYLNSGAPSRRRVTRICVINISMADNQHVITACSQISV